uniref:Uncharacterized protein n=1 Tax=viral metagenome TaxID=1070528 RepID=A0A6H1ZQY5_9ZZZZ
MEDVKCLSCNGVLFKKNALDNKGNWAMDPQHSLDLIEETDSTYFKCPHCSIKNIVVDSISPTGLGQLKIVRVEK